MVANRFVIGLKSVIYFFNSHGMNKQAHRKGKNLKKGKCKNRDMVYGFNFTFFFFLFFAFPGSLVIRSMANQTQKNAFISIMS